MDDISLMQEIKVKNEELFMLKNVQEGTKEKQRCVENELDRLLYRYYKSIGFL